MLRPSIWCGAYPKILSAAGLRDSMTPRASKLITASAMDPSTAFALADSLSAMFLRGRAIRPQTAGALSTVSRNASVTTAVNPSTPGKRCGRSAMTTVSVVKVTSSSVAKTAGGPEIRWRNGSIRFISVPIGMG